MSYLVVKNDTERKSYSLTDQWETKPYLKVKDGNNVEGILPLTTDIEYTTLTSTYISSSSDSEGMSNITYLTCESTSGTSYLTESVAANPYLSMHTLQRVTNAVSQTATTAQMPSYKSSVTYSQTSINSWSNITKTSIYNSNTNSSTVRFSADTSGSYSMIRSGTSNGFNVDTTSSGSNLRFSTLITLANTTYSDVRYTTTSAKVGNSLRYSNIQTYKTNYNSSYIKGLSAYSYESVTVYFSGTSSVSTTGTSYLTRESTSGYSGELSSTYTSYPSIKLVNKISDSTYRANYWTSESGSFYTSAEQSEGMYDVTALTRESTSGTSYLTVSTSTLPYVDIIRIHNETLSTTQHATTEGMHDLTNINTTQLTSINRYYNVTSFSTSQSKSSATILYRCNNVATISDISYTSKVSSNHSGYPGEQHITSSTIHTEIGNQYANSSSNYTTRNWINGTSQYAGTWYTYTLVASSYMSGTNRVFVYGSLKNVRGGRNDPAKATYYQTFEPYLTSTVYYPASSAESTTGTSYLTCESTSGYSGISSTSSGTWI